jgi:hypothetical protein|tara:strand:+ start:1393 stop:1587 length:195 start_codon:yes stop_codon:yes gene_type:complete
MKKTLDKTRIHPEGWKIFLDEPGISSGGEAAGRPKLSWELSLKHSKAPLKHHRYHFMKRGQPSA